MSTPTYMNLKVGDTVWRFDPMRRSCDAWVSHKIIGETRVSWILEPKWDPYKIPKRPKKQPGVPILRGWAYTAAERDQLDWMKRNQNGIAGEVGRERDYKTLRKIADLIGWTDN